MPKLISRLNHPIKKTVINKSTQSVCILSLHLSAKPFSVYLNSSDVKANSRSNHVYVLIYYSFLLITF